ncbi:lytic transglycosylase domain-containing protein [Consotaella salsifontis]|uniref:Soluble lytic murein transglycosylase n=1 Tax=Consotaella salsifontis TaxID=1365950 RepID=A0A1T4QJV4_9HYPH|nr:transglycosylase SLT domain-containing protein [Consotaella salsifontis]SKA03917.1 Soluble lytic murein transglycosylase [Consotaella salsifontis]
MALCMLPLALGACVSNQSADNQTKTVSLADVTATYGYAPSPVYALADGTHLVAPSSKPQQEADTAVPADQTASIAPSPASDPATSGKTGRIKPGEAKDPVAALQADVADHRAAERLLAKARATAAPAGAAETSSAGAAAATKVAEGTDASIAEKVAAAPAAAKEAVSQTIAAVGTTAEAATVATIDTTKSAVATTGRAIASVSQRIGDTFMASDSITGSSNLDKMIETAAVENDIPPELAFAVVRVESHYNPKAKGGRALGLSQIKPATARSLGFAGPSEALYDPETNLRYGMKYLAGAWEQGGHDICQTAMKYKGGHRTTVMSRAAATYCANVKKHMAAIERRRMRSSPITTASLSDKDMGSSARSLPGVVPVPTFSSSNRITTLSSQGSSDALTPGFASAESIGPSRSGR